MPANTPRLGLPYPLEADGETFYPAVNQSQMTTLDSAAIDTQGPLASIPTAGTYGRYYWATDAQSLWRDNGTIWVQVYPTVTNQIRTFTTDDQTGPNPASAILGAFPIYPASGESVALVGVIAWAVTPGTTPASFKIRTDHAVHGTYADVTGLTGIVLTSAAALTSISPFALSALDRICVVCTNPMTTTSVGVNLGVITTSTG